MTILFRQNQDANTSDLDKTPHLQVPRYALFLSSGTNPVNPAILLIFDNNPHWVLLTSQFSFFDSATRHADRFCNRPFYSYPSI